MPHVRPLSAFSQHPRACLLRGLGRHSRTIPHQEETVRQSLGAVAHLVCALLFVQRCRRRLVRRQRGGGGGGGDRSVSDASAASAARRRRRLLRIRVGHRRKRLQQQHRQSSPGSLPSRRELPKPNVLCLIIAHLSCHSLSAYRVFAKEALIN